MTNPILIIVINILATGVLFVLTTDENEPFIAPISEVSMVLRWAVISAVIAFLQFMWMRGWRKNS